MKPRLLLADDDHSIRQMLQFVLTKTCACEIAGQFSNGADALEAVPGLRPTAIVADLRMPVVDGVDLLQKLRQAEQRVPVIFYSAASDEPSLARAVSAEPEGFVLKCDELSELRATVNAVCSGGTYWAPEAEKVRERCRRAVRQSASLTPSEREVLKLLAVGNCTKEIATALGKSNHTVSHQRQSIMDKLKVHSAITLAAFARTAGLVD